MDELETFRFTTKGSGNYTLTTRAINWDRDRRKASRRIGGITSDNPEEQLDDQYCTFRALPAIDESFVFLMIPGQDLWTTTPVVTLEHTEIVTEPQGGWRE